MATQLNTLATKRTPHKTTQSHGVMVAPGRYINLTPRSGSLSQRIMQSIQSAMLLARFPSGSLGDQRLLLGAILKAKDYRAHPHHSYQGKKVTRLSFGTGRSNKRDQEQIRQYLMGMMWYVWTKGTGTCPTVNARGNPDTPFVIFVKSLAPWFRMGNVIKNLERYQSYRKATMAGYDYRMWKRSHP